MENKTMPRIDGLNGLKPSSVSSVVAIAINCSKKSKYLLKWAFENLIPEGGPSQVCFKLLHVFPEINTVPTPMGNGIPIAQVRDDIASAYRKEVESQTSEKILPYKMLCIRKKVQAEIVQIESNDIVNSIAEEISKFNINKLVIGVSSTGGVFSSSYWTSKGGGQNLSAKISESCPSFCTVYAVSKGKLSSVRPSDPEAISTTENARFSSYSSNYTMSPQPDWMVPGSTNSYSSIPPPSPTNQLRSSPTINHSITERTTNWSDHNRNLSHFVGEGYDDGIFTGSTYTHSNIPPPSPTNTMNHNSTDRTPNSSEKYRTLSYYIGEGDEDGISALSSSDITDQKSMEFTIGSVRTDGHSWTTDQSSSLNVSTEFSSGSQVNINFELEQLRKELKHVQGMYAKAQTEAIDASRKLSDLHEQRFEETIKLQEISLKEDEAKELAEQEKARYETTKKEAEYAKECAEKEAALKSAAERKANRDAKTKEKLESSMAGPVHHYQEFTWEEISSATSSFSDDLRVGMGSYGTVYKCSLRHTTAAVKILHSMAANRAKQFQQELEILSRIRHPNLLSLLGACPDRGCLIYEYMENGSLEERLFRKNNTPPIPWFERYRIACEVASALVFLHNTNPTPIIHRDLKPANILLDHNFVSKIGDVGLSTMLHTDMPSNMATTFYKDTSPVGTFCYIDPEYQRTGMLSAKSDVYAFGMVVLQLLTAKQAIALTRTVEMALDGDRLNRVLDVEAGEWPIEETKELAMLALRCTELRHRDRPDLRSQIIPALQRLRVVADKARDLAASGPTGPPNHFLCPILKDVMSDPCVAADGYTYERKAIEEWLDENGTSPMTNMPLLNKSLIPNFTLVAAITEWKSGK